MSLIYIFHKFKKWEGRENVKVKLGKIFLDDLIVTPIIGIFHKKNGGFIVVFL